MPPVGLKWHRAKGTVRTLSCPLGLGTLWQWCPSLHDTHRSLGAQSLHGWWWVCKTTQLWAQAASPRCWALLWPPQASLLTAQLWKARWRLHVTTHAKCDVVVFFSPYLYVFSNQKGENKKHLLLLGSQGKGVLLLAGNSKLLRHVLWGYSGKNNMRKLTQ